MLIVSVSEVEEFIKVTVRTIRIEMQRLRSSSSSTSITHTLIITHL